jgi:hypothetical protein
LSLLIAAVDADAVQQIALLARMIDERLAGKQVHRDLVEILRRQRIQLLRTAAAVAPIGGKGEGNIEIVLRLLAARARSATAG